MDTSLPFHFIWAHKEVEGGRACIARQWEAAQVDPPELVSRGLRTLSGSGLQEKPQRQLATRPARSEIRPWIFQWSGRGQKAIEGSQEGGCPVPHHGTHAAVVCGHRPGPQRLGEGLGARMGWGMGWVKCSKVGSKPLPHR